MTEAFYRRTAARGLETRGRRTLKLAEHVPDMLRARSLTAGADVAHWQWITVPGLDNFLLPPSRPRAYTVHYPLPESRAAVARERLSCAAWTRSSSTPSRARARCASGSASTRPASTSIPHGAFDYLTRLPEERPLPPELAEVEGPVVLCFGLLRPYKGIDVLIEAFREIDGAELWIVGMPRMPIEPLRELAARCRATIRFIPRFVTDPEIPAFFRRADVVVLPHRQIEQSGVLYTALAFGKPIVASAVGGFVDVGEHGAAKLVPPGDTAALSAELRRLIEDAEARRALGEAAAELATSAYSWDSIAARTLAIYRELL